MKITIIGGGTAGWLTALYIIRKQPQHQVTVIDSSKLGIIGVGEGTTGKFMDIIQNKLGNFGIDEAEFIRETGATMKMGIKFVNWLGQGESWISPIDNTPTLHYPSDLCLIDHYAKWGRDQLHTSTPCGTLADQNLSCITKDGRATFATNAYHFDGHQVGQYFKKVVGKDCQLIDSEIESWSLDSQGNVATVSLANGDTVSSDYWIDCSGFARVLAPAVDPGWHSYRDSLSCDSVLLFHTKHWHLRDTIEPLTLAEAMDAGWRFRIPTQERYGNGYVFDSSCITAEQALAELQRKDPKIELRKVIKFEPGRLERPFSKNVAFIGLSAVFLEPLQATSIHGTIAQLQQLEESIIRPDSLPQGPWEYQACNHVLNETFDQYADLVQLHYKSGRTDTEFWRKQTNDMAFRPKVAHLKELTQRRWPSPGDFYLSKGGASYGVFIYPILAYGWVNMQAVAAHVHGHKRDWNHYYAQKAELARQCIPHSQFVGQAKKIRSLEIRPWPRPVMNKNHLHPLLR